MARRSADALRYAPLSHARKGARNIKPTQGVIDKMTNTNLLLLPPQWGELFLKGNNMTDFEQAKREIAKDVRLIESLRMWEQFVQVNVEGFLERHVKIHASSYGLG
jgi:hypothetical protein